MGQVIARKIRGMNLWAKVALTVLFTFVLSVFMYEGWYKPSQVQAAITAVQNETNIYHNAALPGATAASFAVSGTAGTRMLVVSLSYEASSSAALTATSVTYGGVAMTLAGGDAATSLSMHSMIYYLKDNAVMDGTAKTLAVNITGGGTAVMQNIWYAVYTGVDQAATPTVQNYNSAGTAVTSAAFATALTVNANDQAVLVATAARATAAVTWNAPTNWTKDNNQPSGTTGLGFVATRAIPATNTTDTASSTGITSSRVSMTAMSMKAATAVNTTTLGTGTNASNATVCPATAGQKLGGFSFTTSAGTDSITGLTVTTTGQAGIASLQIWNEAGTTQYFSTVNNPGTDTWTFSGGTPLPASTTASSYKILATYDPYAAAPAGSTATTGYVSAYTCTNTKAGADTAEATVTLNHTASTAATWGSNSGGTSVTLNWTNGNGSNAMIVRYTAANDTTMPTAGTTYTVSQAYGTGGTVIYEGTGTTTTNNPGAGTYYYRIFAHDSCSNYATTAPWTSALTVTASCTRTAPTVSLGSNGQVSPNGQKAYTLTVTNNDSASCSNSTFTLSIPSETGNTASFVLPSTLGSTSTGTVLPQAAYNTTFTVKAQTSATLGHTLTSTVNAADATNHAAQTGTSTVATTVANVFTSPLMHNATNLASTYRGGSWGNNKDCTWCHSVDTTNVKRVATSIQTLEGAKKVTFTRMTSASHAVPGVMGDDQRTYATQASTNVCEVCHHNTTYHQYSGSKVGVPVQHASHPNNNKDCTGCHAHSNGFKADCSSCHGFPPTVLAFGGPNGLAIVGAQATLALGGTHTVLPGTVGAHAAHGTLGMLCATCHNNYATGVSHPSTSIQIDFAINNSNWPGKFAGSAAFGTFSGNAPTGGSPAVSSSGGTTLVRTTANNTNNSCNVYCHGNWTGSNGNTNPRWGGGSSQSNCGTCHGATNAQAPQTGSHTVHASNSAGNYGFNCSKCHATVSGGADGHVNGSVQWRLSTASPLIGATATYKSSASSSTGSVALGAAFGDCANIYCHSNGLATPTYVTGLTWGATAEGNCGTCHGVTNAAPPASAAHIKHVGSAAGYIYSCATCHNDVANATFHSTTSATIKSTTLHVNKANDVKFDTTKVGTAGTYTDPNCTNTYCHSPGVTVATGGTPSHVALSWSAGVQGCATCHTGGTTTGPTYASGSPKTNSHDGHTKAGVAYTCDVCHMSVTSTGTTITTPANHANKVYNVSANTAKTGAFTYTYLSTGGTCANTRCHGPQTMTWGANTTDAQCTKCHGKPTTVANYSTSTSKQAAPGYGTTGVNLSGVAGTFTNGVSNDSKVGAHDAHLRSINNYTGRDVLCTDCHTVPATVNAAGHLDGNGADMIWSNLSKNTGTSGSVSTRGTLTPGYATGTCSTNYCHGGVLNGGTDTTPVWNDTAYLTAYAKNATNCGKCHGAPPTSGATLGYTHSGYTIANSCAGCHGHEGTGPTHIDGILQASGDCNSCHDYDTTNGGGTWGKGTAYTTGGWGAHAVHINYIKKRLGVTLNPSTDTFGNAANAGKVCGVCHTNLESNHSTTTPTNGRQMTFGENLTLRKFGASNPIFNTSPRTCSNIDCHYLTTPAWQ